MRGFKDPGFFSQSLPAENKHQQPTTKGAVPSPRMSTFGLDEWECSHDFSFYLHIQIFWGGRCNSVELFSFDTVRVAPERERERRFREGQR